MAKIITGKFMAKTKDGKETPIEFITATELDGSPETCKKVGQALLDWLNRDKNP